MTWKRMKALVSALLSGDHILPDDEESRIALLQYALEETVDLSQALKLEVSEDEPVDAILIGYNNMKFRKPNLPINDDSEIDIDDGLTYAVARFMTSYLSMEKFNVHRGMAKELCKRYSDKVESLRQESAKLGVGNRMTFIEEDQYE